MGRKIKWYQTIQGRAAMFFPIWFGIFFYKFGWGVGAIINVAQLVFILIAGGFAGFIPNPFKKNKEK